MFFSRTTVVVKSVVEVKELEVVLDGILNVDNDVVSMSDIAKRLKLTPAAAYSACKKLKSTDPRFGITTGLDGERLLFRVPVAGAHMASIVGRLFECVRFKAWRVRNDVRRISAYRACVRHQLHEVRTAMTTIDKRVRRILQRASSDHCKEVRISEARQIVHLRFDLSRVSAHEEHLQQRAMIFDRHLDDLATSAFGHECPVPLPLPSVLVHASKTAETARENMADLLYLSMQAIELSPQITNDQLELALRELEASTEINAKSAQSGRSADSKDLRDA